MSSLARPPGVHVTLSAEGQLLAKEQVFRGQGRPGPEAAPQEPQDVDPERNTGPTQMDQSSISRLAGGVPSSTLALNFTP